MKIYIPQIISENQVSGGFTFLRNFRKGITKFCEITQKLAEADVVFIPGVTMVNSDEVELAKKMYKPIVFRMDNIPRKSRNKRSRVYDHIKKYAEISDVVIYQSEWARNYCYPIAGDGTVIYNGVDLEIFNDKGTGDIPDRENNYLFAYHGKSELKQFWLAHYYFQMEFRKNPNALFKFIYNFRSELQEQIDANFDFWNNEKYQCLDFIDTPAKMANLMRGCKYLIYPSVCDASPNIVLEARACGMEVLYPASEDLAGTKELLNPNLDISLDRMCKEYNAIFELVCGDHEINTGLENNEQI